MVDDGTWNDYVTEAGTDPGALDVVAGDMTDVATQVDAAVDSIDTTALPDDVAAAVTDAGYNATQAASWSSWAQGDLADAASWQDAATDHVAAAQEWLADGNVSGFEIEMSAAATASDNADGVVGRANTDLGIGAEYMDSSVAAVDTAAFLAVDSTAAVETSSYDAGSYDAAPADVSTDA
jgi:hypothetical protein